MKATFFNTSLVVLASWIAVSLLLAMLVGWLGLAKHYRCRTRFKGQKWYFQTGSMIPAHYIGCLTTGASGEGVYLAVLPLFRLGHPPLLIPWSDITATEHKGLLFSYLDFKFSSEPSVTLRVPRDTGERILSAHPVSSLNAPGTDGTCPTE
jgi:hypothetical protein